MAKWRKSLPIVIVFAIIAFIFYQPVIGALGNDKSLPSELPVKQIDGEWYVKLDDVQKLVDLELEASKDLIPNVIAEVSPSVVAIVGRPQSRMDHRYAISHGTGVIIDSNGWILTNAHVVKDIRNTTVITPDGEQYSAKLTHIDEASDLAIVKIEATKLPTLSFASEPAQVGETVIAIGNPISFSLQNSATVGTVSGTDRAISTTYRLLQTDAAVNPGNSGGPLVNLDGEIVGIVTMKYISEGIDNLSFAIPADTVQYVTNHFKKYGKVNRPQTGLHFEESWAAIIGLPSKEPLKVTRVDKGLPADKAGIRAGDLLYRIGDQAIHSVIDYNEALKNYLPGEKVEFTLQSGGKSVKKTVTLQ